MAGAPPTTDSNSSTSTSSTALSAAELFNDVGPAYEAAFADLAEQAASIEWLLSELSTGADRPAQVLDIGCGTGRPVCSRLAAAGHSVLGIDISTEMIKAAREQVAEATFELRDVRDFQSPPARFDAVTAYFSLLAGLSQDEIRQTVQRIHTWLKPGGSFVLATVPVPVNNVELKWMGRAGIVSSLARDEFVAWIRQVGFDVVHDQESTFLPKAVEAGICGPDDVWEESHLFVYAKKKAAAAAV
jgi:cyclopropane fatty-acyl-phospholipid synthase-like methyltransferase